MVKLVTGNIIDLADRGILNVIAHCCNCRARFTGPTSIAIGARWPRMVLLDAQKHSQFNGAELGQIESGHFKEEHLSIVNCYTQAMTGENHNDEAFKSCMNKLYLEYGTKNMRIGISELTQRQIEILRTIFVNRDINVITW